MVVFGFEGANGVFSSILVHSECLTLVYNSIFVYNELFLLRVLRIIVFFCELTSVLSESYVLVYIMNI